MVTSPIQPQLPVQGSDAAALLNNMKAAAAQNPGGNGSVTSSPLTPPGKVPATPPPPSGNQKTTSKPPLSAEDIIRQQITNLQQPTFVQKHPWSYLLFLLPGVASGYYRAYAQRQALLGNLMGKLSNIQEQNKAYGLRSQQLNEEHLRNQGILGRSVIQNAQMDQARRAQEDLTQQRVNNEKAYQDAMIRLRNREVTARASGKNLSGADQMVTRLLEAYPAYLAKAQATSQLTGQQPLDVTSYLSRFPGMLNAYYRIMGLPQPTPGSSTGSKSGASPIPGQLFLPN